MTDLSATDRDKFKHSIALANVPTLQLVLVQLTGDSRWLEPPYLPAPLQGKDPLDSGGLSEELQSDIHRAALDAIVQWRAGKPIAIPRPSDEQLHRMFSESVGAPVPEEYVPYMKEVFAGGKDLQNPDPSPDVPDGFRVVIVGGGPSSIIAAVNLLWAGITDFVIYEQEESIGGSWWENRYPGAAVDTPTHLYSLSFASWDWSQYFADRAELLAYFNATIDDFGIRSHYRFSTEVERLAWDEGAQLWRVTARAPRGRLEESTANAVIAAVGAFNPPVLPKIPGMEKFAGPSFHPARWPKHFDASGKRVAVVGSGASAMQIVPELSRIAGKLFVFQRTPAWIAPHPQFRLQVPDAVTFLAREVPLYQHWYRLRIAWSSNDWTYPLLRRDPDWTDRRAISRANDDYRATLVKYIEEKVGDRTDLLPKVVPTYPAYGKRMLRDNGWYDALIRPNVELITDGIQEITETGIVTSGGSYDVDAIVYATGFAMARYLATIPEVLGIGGQEIHALWHDDDARAYLGTTVPGFPNFFMLYGPNVSPGHGGSLFSTAEPQMKHATRVLRVLLAAHATSAEVQPAAFERYNALLDERLPEMVWSHPDVTSYYKNSSNRVVAVSPFRVVELWGMFDNADIEKDYSFTRRPSLTEVGAPQL